MNRINNEIIINDLFDELREENNRLLNELKFAQKYIQLLENYRNCLIDFKNNCKCDEKNENQLIFDLLENGFKNFKSLKIIEDIIECNEMTFNCDLNEDKNRNKRKQILRPNNAFELITHQNIESVVDNNGSQTHLIHEDFGSVDVSLDFNLMSDKSTLNNDFENEPKFIPLFESIPSEVFLQEIDETSDPIISQSIGIQSSQSSEPNSSSKVLKTNKYKRSRRGPHLKTFVCDWPQCEYKCNRNNMLSVHKLRHTGFRPYNCSFPGCDRKFYTNVELNVHKKRVHSEKGEFKCGYKGCPSVLSNFYYWKDHQKLHSPNNVHICQWPECGKRFLSKTHHEKHKLVHTGVKKYFCLYPDCGKAFACSSNMKKHTKLHLR